MMPHEPLTCDAIQTALLETDWDQGQRDRFARILAHAADCPACRKALADYDRLRATIGMPSESAEPALGWDAFQHRLADYLEETAAQTAAWQPRPRILPFLRIAALAASVALAAIGWGLYARSAGSRPVATVSGMTTETPTNPSSANLRFTDQEIAQQVRAFDQVSASFDERASWMLTGEHTSDVGLAPAPLTMRTRLLLLRLTVLKNDAIVSNADLVVVAGQTAELTVPITSGHNLRYHIGTTAGDNPRLSLWAELLKLNQPSEALAAIATSLQARPGDVLNAGQMVTSAGEYQIKIAFSRASSAEPK